MPNNVWQTPLGQSTLARMREQKEAAERQKTALRQQQLAQRMYASARATRLSGGILSSSSANAELRSSLASLRDRSRQLIRDSAYAKRARKIVVDNVIGTGIGMQPAVRGTRGELRKSVNDAISTAWWEWARPENCHTGGKLHFVDLERLIMGQVFDAGEILIRLHPRAVGDSEIPLSLEVIEPERLADQIEPSAIAPENKCEQGIEVDAFYRPVRYWIRRLHPGEMRTGLREIDRVEGVPASQIIHLHLVDRWPQVRGEPWMHAVIRKLADIDGYTEAEIVAARAASMYFGTIESNDDTEAFGEQQEDGSYQLPLEPGMVEKLRPGEKLNFVNPNRPNSALDPFLRYMLREMAAGVGVSYESLSRDYSQSNYSSSRLALLEDRDNWRALQGWVIRMFRDRLHRVWLQQASAARAIQGVTFADYATDPKKFSAVAFKPRGWSWVDPTKEVEAYKEAVKAGFTTVADVVAQTAGGLDLEEVLEQRRRELDEMDELDLVFDTSPESYAKPEPAPAAAAAPASTDSTEDDDAEDDEPKSRGVTVNVAAPVVHNHVAPADVRIPLTIQNPVHVDAPTVNVEPVTVSIPRSLVIEQPPEQEHIGNSATAAAG